MHLKSEIDKKGTALHVSFVDLICEADHSPSRSSFRPSSSLKIDLLQDSKLKNIFKNDSKDLATQTVSLIELLKYDNPGEREHPAAASATAELTYDLAYLITLKDVKSTVTVAQL